MKRISDVSKIDSRFGFRGESATKTRAARDEPDVIENQRLVSSDRTNLLAGRFRELNAFGLSTGRCLKRQWPPYSRLTANLNCSTIHVAGCLMSKNVKGLTDVPDQDARTKLISASLIQVRCGHVVSPISNIIDVNDDRRKAVSTTWSGGPNRPARPNR